MAEHRWLPLGAALCPLILLAGCGDTVPPTTSTPAMPVAPPSTASAANPGSATDKPPLVDPAFTPLPSPQQVKQAQPIGQLDPFRPLQREVQDLAKPKSSDAAAGSQSGSLAAGAQRARPAAPPPPLQVPPDLLITGLIGRPGRAEAVVTYQGVNGTVRVGDRGSAPGSMASQATTLLPLGWSVAAIDVNRGQIKLQYNGRTTLKTI